MEEEKLELRQLFRVVLDSSGNAENEVNSNHKASGPGEEGEAGKRQQVLLASGQQYTGQEEEFGDDGLGETAEAEEFTVCIAEDKVVQMVEVGSGRRFEPVWLKDRVVCQAWNSNGSCCVVGDERGVVHFLNRKGRVLFSQKVLGTSKMQFQCLRFIDMPSFFDNEQVGDDLFVVTSNPCKIIRLSNLNLQMLEDVAVSENKALLQTLRESVTSSTFDLSHDHERGIQELLVHRNPVTGFLHMLLVDSYSCRLSVYIGREKGEDADTSLLDGVESGGKNHQVILEGSMRDPLEKDGHYVQLAPLTEDKQVLLALTDKGALRIWDGRQLFLLGEAFFPPNAGVVDTKCVSLVSLGNGGRVGFLFANGSLLVGKIRLGRYIDVEFAPNVKLPSGTRFVECWPGQNSSPRAILFGYDPEHQDAVVAVECRESSPLARVQKLISKGRFEEAFAMVERDKVENGTRMVLKGKLGWLLKRANEQLATHADADQVDDGIMKEVESLCDRLAALDPESELGYIVAGCVNVSLPGAFRSQIRLLEVALRLCEQFAPRSSLLEEIQTLCFRAETFRLLHNDGVNTVPDAWHAFRVCDLSQELRAALRQGQFHTASLLVERHGRSFPCETDASSYLECIPLEVPVVIYGRWVRDRGSALLSLGSMSTEAADVVEKNRSAIASWALERALQVEQTRGPVSSLDLVTNVMHTLRPNCMNGSASSINFQTPAQRRAWISNDRVRTLHGKLQQDSQGRLVELQENLVELVYLLEQHGLNLRLEHFHRIGREEAVMLLLDRITAPELVPEQIRKHVAPCSARYGLQLDNVLTRFVERAAGEIDSADSAKEQCATCIARNIQDKGLASQAVLSLMRNISPPYSEELSAVVQDALQFATEYQEDILEQKRLMDLRGLVTRFRVENRLNFSNATQARALVQYVLASGHSVEVVQDALEIARAYQYIDLSDVLSNAVENMIVTDSMGAGKEERQAVEAFVERLSRIAYEEGATTESAFLSRGISFCELTVECRDASEEEMFRAACAGSVFASLQPRRWGSLKGQFATVRDMWAAFQIRLRMKSIATTSAWKETFKEHVVLKCAELDASEVIRRAYILLQANPEMKDVKAETASNTDEKALDFICTQLAVGFALQKDFGRCLEWCRRIQEPSSLYKAALEIAMRFPNVMERHEEIEELLSKSAEGCSMSLLPRVVELLRSSSLIAQILKRCDAGSDHAQLWSTSVDDESGHIGVCVGNQLHQSLGSIGKLDGRFLSYQDQWFRESESVLIGDRIVGLVVKLLILVEGARNGRQAPVAETRQAVVDYLNENGATQLALYSVAICSIQPSQEQKGKQSAGTLLENCLKQLAEKSLGAKDVDGELSLGYLVSVEEEEEAWKGFKSNLKVQQNDFDRLERLARIGIDAERLRMVRNFGFTQDCRELAINARWWGWLTRIGVAFESSELETPSRSRTQFVEDHLFAEVVEKSGFDLERSVSFAVAYGMEREKAVLAFTKVLLTRWKPQQARGDVSEPTKTLKKVLGIIPGKGMQTIWDMFAEVDGRDYGLLRSCAELLVASGDKAIVTQANKYLQVLELLETYEEFSRELAKGRERQAERIDFHALWLDNPWPEIAKYLSPNSIKWLVALGDPLGHGPDDFYLCLAKNLAQRVSAPKQILSFVSQVKDTAKAVKFCDWLAQQASCRNAQVLALSYAVDRTRKDGSRDEALEARLHKLLTEVDLLRIESEIGESMGEDQGKEGGVQSRRLSQSWDASNPEELLNELYDRYSEVAATVWQDTDKLHNIAARIAARYSIDLDRILRHLVLRMLSEDTAQCVSGDDEQQCVFEPLMAERRLEVEERLLRKISYALRWKMPGSEEEDQRLETQRATALLLNYVFRGGKSFQSVSRALAAVFQIASLEDIECIYQQNPNEMLESAGCSLSQYWQYCTYMVEFEELRLPRTVEQLIRCDKVGLINALWRDYRAKPRVVQLVATLIVDFELFRDTKVLEAVMVQMNKLGMIRQLLVFLGAVLSSFLVRKAVGSSETVHQVFTDAAARVFREAKAFPDHAGRRAVLELLRVVFVKLENFAEDKMLSVLLSFHATQSVQFALETALSIPRVSLRTQLVESFCQRLSKPDDQALARDILAMLSPFVS